MRADIAQVAEHVHGKNEVISASLIIGSHRRNIGKKEVRSHVMASQDLARVFQNEANEKINKVYCFCKKVVASLSNGSKTELKGFWIGNIWACIAHHVGQDCG